ncbi:uncharacterized protein LOC112141289 isoform X2 [Xyrichtys novacula]|uniref:Uncharacterized protein LOC112141289 isoform X2 n=1 Tax=Xyrichtys novacula TaxID=13765 RepID=A0AAV1GDR3_XYRNO|nr:uncharacterized protein LOC112141289 isoform X2 [Xyrichtys novacula]
MADPEETDPTWRPPQTLLPGEIKSDPEENNQLINGQRIKEEESGDFEVQSQLTQPSGPANEMKSGDTAIRREKSPVVWLPLTVKAAVTNLSRVQHAQSAKTSPSAPAAVEQENGSDVLPKVTAVWSTCMTAVNGLLVTPHTPLAWPTLHRATTLVHVRPAVDASGPTVPPKRSRLTQPVIPPEAPAQMEENESKMHISIVSEGNCLPGTLSPLGFGCPLCPRYTPTAQASIERHLKRHLTNGVSFEGKVICRCHLPCRDKSHYHCLFCEATVLQKPTFIRHMQLCLWKIYATRDTATATESAPPQDTATPPESTPTRDTATPPRDTATPPESTPTRDTATPPEYTPPRDTATPPESTPPRETATPPESTPTRDTATPPEYTPPRDTATPPEYTPPHQSPSSENQPAALSSATTMDHSYSCSFVSPVEGDHSYSKAVPAPPPLVAAPEPDKEIDSTDVDPIASEKELTSDLPPKHIRCPYCGLVLYKKNLLTHVARKHELTDVLANRYLKSTLVDARHGLFAVQKRSKGFTIPVHVQRKTWGQHSTTCELEDCQQYHLLAQRSGLPSFCHHIRSLDYCATTATEETLDHEVLKEMVDNNIFNNSKATLCLTRQQEAKEAQVPFSVLVDLTGSKNNICLSIHEPKLHHYSTLGRLFVVHNTERNTWHCPCVKARLSCPHKYIAKWHLFQTRRNLFRSSLPTTTAVKTSPSAIQSTVDMASSVKYVYNAKKIPTPLPDEVTARRPSSEIPRHLFPIETTCMHCTGAPDLEEPVRITNKAKVVGMEGLVLNISTYRRRCPKCQVVYRYQEWTDGLHNYNNHIIITLQLCLFLRYNIQNHVSVSRLISSLESLLKMKFPASNLILQGYCHFEALCNTEYQYSCVSCGFYPSVVVMDLYRKGVFNFEVSELDQPGQEFKGEHDIDAFWQSIELHMISRGFFENPSQNPFVVHPTYDNWAPWIGGQTRRGNIVFNTEFAKVPLKTSSADPQLGDLPEDHLVDELLKQKVSTIRNLCKTCNLDTMGSRIDLVNQLRDEMKSRQTYDKVFQSIWGASGGWSVIMCPHGIVYSVKYNLRAESPRDFADMLLSWKHLPNVCIYNFAQELVAHMNLRVPESPPFQPFEGRLAEPTKENVEAAGQGRLQVHLPWLVNKLETPESGGHPITGSKDHYVLYDKFHQANTKDPLDVLRRIQVVPELQGTLNSQVAKQLFAVLRHNNYFLNNMGPSAHIFLMRSIIEHRNTKLNEKQVECQLRRGLSPASTATEHHPVEFGPMIIGQQTFDDTDECVQTEPLQTDGGNLDEENTVLQDVRDI